MSDSPVQAAASSSAEATAHAKTPFYSRRDKLAFAIAAAVTFVSYVWTLSPSVTLEDSGEFITAGHNLGVPHPPGYPIWTILAWLWQWIIPFGNIAWRMNLMSAFFGAIAIGLTALLISKSGHEMAAKVGFLHGLPDQRLVDWVVLAGSVSAALMLAFAPVMWSQAVIAEVYALNAFFLLVTLLLLYRWRFEPERRWRLYLAAFVWGVGLTNHQTLVLLTVAFPAYVWFVDRKLGRDVLAPILLVIVAAILKMIVTPGSMFREGPFSGLVVGGLGVAAGAWLYLLWKEGPGLMRMWRQVIALYASVLAGLALYAYMPVSSATNPPMNWGYTRTTQGFLHHFTRGQYEKVRTERTPLQFWAQLNMFFDDLQSQFNVIYALAALVALFFYREMGRKERDWLKFLLIGFLFLGFGFIFLSNPTFEKQKLVTDRVFFLPGHCLYSLWIGYGLILGLGYLLQKPGMQTYAVPLVVVAGLLPLFSVIRNWSDNEQRHHDFGYRFGYSMFKPGGEYPEMDRDAVLYGGTDPGRFVPTYMIFVESQVPPRAKTRMPRFPESSEFDRRDVYIITQNALADGTYMNYIRDHYDYGRPDPSRTETLAGRSAWQRALFNFGWNALGRSTTYPKEPIWIPGEKDSQEAFTLYIQELQTRPRLPGEDIRMEGGRVSVQGVQGVMAVNGYLTRMIFERNKDKHSFYIEESFPIPWMYPYLEPYGIILKINKEPLQQFDPAVVARDTRYWDALGRELKGLPQFHRDDMAQKTFSKLRSAIASVYAFRRMWPEAETAFLQAIELCPESPEANYRLAQMYAELGRFDEGTAILERYRKLDRYNTKILEAIETLKELRKAIERQKQLEQQVTADPNNIAAGMELAAIYAQRQRFGEMDAVVAMLVQRPNISESEFLAIAQLYARLNRTDRLTELLNVFTQRFPRNPAGWYNLSIVHAVRNQCDEATAALERALAFDGPGGQIHDTARQDPRLNNCRNHPRFQLLMGQGSAQATPGGFTVGR